jgi:hypothetical protein
MSAKTLTLRLEDKPQLANKLEALKRITRRNTYMAVIEKVIFDYEHQERTIEQLRKEILRLKDIEQEQKNIIHRVNNFLEIPALLKQLARPSDPPAAKKKSVKTLLDID